MKPRSLLATAVGLSVGMYLPTAMATDYTFTGTGDWFASGSNPNWSPAVSNGLSGTTLNSNNALIQGAVNYNGSSAGDFQVGNGNAMTIDGGSWTQAAATGNWIKVGGSGGIGTVFVRNGGSFVADGGLLRLGEDGGTGVFTVESSAGSGGLKLTVNTEMSSASTINLQGGTNSFAQIQATGHVNVSGGTSTMTGALNTSSTSDIHISGGSLTNTGNGNVNLDASSTFLLSGTGLFKMTGTGEFQPGATGTLQGISGSASLEVAGLVAFQGGAPQKFNIDGGTIKIGAPQSNNNSIFSNGAYFNFTANSTGSILFTNNGSAESNIYTGFKIRYLDATYTIATFDSVFDVTHPTAGSTLIQLDSLTSVPEPSTWMVGSLAFATLLVTQRRRMLRAIRAQRLTA